VFCLLLAAASAQAQSSYTLSVLSKPGSHKTTAPLALDAAGNAYALNGMNNAGVIAGNNYPLNQAGQVLIRGRDFDAPRPIATHVWQNDVLTAVTGSVVKGQEVYGNAINDSGTVVGCLYNYNRTLSRAAFTPFIWQRGVMENLTTHLASKGLKLPSGQALGCPYAINNAGTILTATYQVSNEKNTRWVRINALP
jgi:uncharacterized membrane protein